MDNASVDYLSIASVFLLAILFFLAGFLLYGENLRVMFYTRENLTNLRIFLTVFPYVALVLESLYLSYCVYKSEH